jgi:putative flippase GtrA
VSTSSLLGAHARIARFIVVGVANTAVSFATFRGVLALLIGTPAAPAIAQVGAYVVGIACSFVLNRGWTFRSGAPRGPELARFVLSQIAMLALSSTIIEIDVDLLRLPASASWVVTTAGVAVVNYLALHHWVFRVPGTVAV